MTYGYKIRQLIKVKQAKNDSPVKIIWSFASGL